jgi:protein SCO1/2
VTRRAVALLLLGCAAVGVFGGLVLHELVRPASTRAALALPELHGQVSWAAGKRPAPAFALRDQSGRLVTPASLRGRPAVLTFLDSHCTSRCPLVGRALAWVVRGLPTSQRPAVVVVSVNPKDTPASARAAVRKWGIPPGWHWLLGDRATLAPVWREYGITVVPTTHDIVHSLAVYLLDRYENERTGYLFPFQPPFVQRDLRALAAERAA